MNKPTSASLASLFLLLGALAVNASTAPVFPTGTSFAVAFTNNSVSYARSVAVADIYGNGKPALVSASYLGSMLSVLTNNGSGVFSLSGTLNVGSAPYAVVATNVSGSKHVDLICANESGNTLSVLTNNGSGGFVTSDTLALKTGSTPYSVTVADIFSNGQLALISANSGNSSLTVFTNAGGGIFVSNATYTVGSQPESVVAADVNGDGYVDLICANSGTTTLTVLTNNGSGVFKVSSSPTVGSEPESVVAADVNGDGYVDLISANYSSSTLTVLTNNGTGGFAASATITLKSGSEPDSVVAKDVNGDGYVDLICANYESSTVVVLTNNGTGSFVPACTNGVALEPYCVAAADIFGYGKPALVTADGNSTLTVLSNTTGFYNPTFTVGSWSNLTVTASGSPTPAFGTTSALPGGVTFVDNGNGTASLAGTPVIGSGGVYTLAVTASNSVSVASQNITLTINQQPIFPGYAFGSGTTNTVGNEPVFITMADIFGTGKPAIISANESGNSLTVLTNNGNGVFGTNGTFAVGSDPESVVAVDIFGNGQPALISANRGSSTLTVLTNNGRGVFGLNTTLSVGNSPDSVTAADIFGNGILALISANYGSGTLSVLTNNGSGGLHLFATLNVGSEPESVVAADVNGDGHVDLICANYNSSTLSVLTNNGSGGFVTSDTITLKANSEPDSVVVADIYNNGKPALICANSESETLTVLTNTGNGIFGSNATYNVNFLLACVAAADVNGDGHVDLICAGNNPPIVLTNNGSGKFMTGATLSTNYYQDRYPQFITTADVNGDGRADLIGAYSGFPNTVSVLTNGPPLLKVTYIETAAGTPYAPPAAGGYPAPALSSATGTLPGGVTFTGGVLSGTPNPGTAGTYNLVLTVTNAFGTNSQNLSLTVSPVITAGTFVLYTDENIPQFVSTNTLLTHDSDRDSYALNITAVSTTSTHGATVGLTNGLVTYTPVTGFTGLDPFTYTIVDTDGDTAQGTVDMEVEPPPVTYPYLLSIDENTPQVISTNTLLANDGDYGPFTLDLPAVNPASTNGGTVTLDTVNGNVDYTPVTGFTGQDQFTYAIVDSDGGTNLGIVSVTIYPPPIAGTFIFSTPENTPQAIPMANVLNNDSDPGSLPLSITAAGATSSYGGTVGLDNVNGNIDYAPAAGYTGPDSFTYTLADNIGGTVPGTVSVIVTRPGAPSYNNIAISPPNGNQLGIAFTGQTNQTYYLQSATNVTGPYTDLPPPIVADQNGLVTNTIVLLPGTPSQFYRISSLP